jgi:hypothetical protein
MTSVIQTGQAVERRLKGENSFMVLPQRILTSAFYLADFDEPLAGSYTGGRDKLPRTATELNAII